MIVFVVVDDGVPDSASVAAALANAALRHTPCKAEVANHDLAIFINKNIRWLHVSVDNVARVQVLKTA